MKEFVEKLIERLEDSQAKIEFASKGCKVNEFIQVKAVKRIIVELAEEYINCSTDTSTNTSSGWIPCSERLPEKNGMYLVTQKRYSLDTRRMIGIETDYVQFSCGEWCRARFLEVIAWQPLPEPYQPKGE